MYLKKHKRKKNGKYNTYYSIVEKRKVSRGRYRDYDRFMKRLGVLESEAGACRQCITLTLPKYKARIEEGEFVYTFEADKYREMIYRDGRYFLRTNQTGKSGSELWQEYMLQCHVEQASFETLDGRTLLMQRYTEPQEDQKLLLHHLKMDLPPQKPPQIYSGSLKK